MSARRFVLCRFVFSRFVFAIALALVLASSAGATTPTTCTTGSLPPGNGEDLIVTTGTCTVNAGTYNYGNVNIYGGGTLQFTDAKIDFWAAGILIENGGSLVAGSTSAPIGTAGGVLTIRLYGKDQGTAGQGGQGILCQSPGGTCGIPSNIWTSNVIHEMNPTSCNSSSLPGGVTDCFYQYMPIDFDGGGDTVGYFGYKVLALSYGGTLQLFGKKGATYNELPISSSGTSWARLNATISQCGSGCSVTLDRAVDWAVGDRVVVTTTDYLPGHSEEVTIKSISTSNGSTTFTVVEGFTYAHNGGKYSLSGVPLGVGPDPDPSFPADRNGRAVETRAAVALLNRSIRIVSAGDNFGDLFYPVSTCRVSDINCYFGGHTIVRQGFQSFQVQGVEFYQLGQGGRIMHYPVHFHMARQTPANTFVKDSSVHDSMTRWYTLHATQGVTLQRNVGYLSIGNGYYMEDGTEANNKLYANLGVFARAAVDNVQNPRAVPGILAGNYLQTDTDEIPYHIDTDHPTVFWIMNGWNDLRYNMAAGAGTCGMCYWLTPAGNSGASRYEYWTGYPSEQMMTVAGGLDNYAQAASSPLQHFIGNSCVSAQNAFITVGATAPCEGVVEMANPTAPRVTPVPNPLAPEPSLPGVPLSPEADQYYPKVASGSGRFPTFCPSESANCGTQSICSVTDESNCAVTVLDHFTTSFNWAQTGIAAMWLRPQWYLLSNSAMTDIQNGGVTFVSGGGYSASDEIPGYWALAHKNVFIGETQPNNNFAIAAGPFNPNSGLKCALQTNNAPNGNFCLNKDEGVALSTDSFALNQRFFNIYDGPSFQDSNAYLDINPTTLTGCSYGNGAACQQSGWMYGNVTGLPLNQKDKSCFLPNAAVAWKQPNGFYYPPEFHSKNLYFSNVSIRHFVIEPLFEPGTFNTDASRVKNHYCNDNADTGGYSGMFNGFTDIDRQTELSDDDGSLTGLVNTVSVNKDHFFDAPVVTPECASGVGVGPMTCSINSPFCGTANTSPYEYVTTVEFPGCAVNNTCGTNWTQLCENQFCYGVPLYREDAVLTENNKVPFIRMMSLNTYQRSTLTVNNGNYYMDTTVSASIQNSWNSQYGAPAVNIFQKGGTYYTFLLFAKPTTTQTYTMYVGTQFDPSSTQQLFVTRVDTTATPPTFSNDSNVITPCGTNGEFPWCYTYSSQTGLLSVTVNMNFSDFQTNYTAAAPDHCMPESYCSWNAQNQSCGCALKKNELGYAECQHACSDWATKAIDCPSGGCYGFGVVLASDFVAGQPAVPPPPMQCFPDTPAWDVPFVAATQQVAGSCFYPTVPQGTFCGGGSKKGAPRVNGLKAVEGLRP